MNRWATTPTTEHTSTGTAAWLLVLPVTLMAFALPPTLGLPATASTATEVSREVLQRPFRRIPPGARPN